MHQMSKTHKMSAKRKKLASHMRRETPIAYIHTKQTRHRETCSYRFSMMRLPVEVIQDKVLRHHSCTIAVILNPWMSIHRKLPHLVRQLSHRNHIPCSSPSLPR